MGYDQRQVGSGGDIKVDDLEGHFPFDKEDGSNWEQILEKSKQEAAKMAAEAKKKWDAKANKDTAKQDAKDKKKDDAEKKKDKESNEEEGQKDCECKDKKKKCDCKKGGNGKNNGADEKGGKSGPPGRHGLKEKSNYVPDTVQRKKPCEFTPANCYCGARPTQQMDLLCASKKREYCGWFCKHKMGGREGKPKTGSNQFPTKPKKT